MSFENSAIDRIIAMLAEVAEQPVSSIDLDSDLAKIGIDSLGFLRLQMRFESDLGVVLPEDVDIDTVTGREIVAYVSAWMPAAARSPSPDPHARS